MIENFHTSITLSAMESTIGYTSLADVAEVAELIHVETIATLNRFLMQNLYSVGGVNFGGDYP